MIDLEQLVADQGEVWRREQQALLIHQQLVQVSLDINREAANPAAQEAIANRYAEIRAAAVAAGLLDHADAGA